MALDHRTVNLIEAVRDMPTPHLFFASVHGRDWSEAETCLQLDQANYVACTFPLPKNEFGVEIISTRPVLRRFVGNVKYPHALSPYASAMTLSAFARKKDAKLYVSEQWVRLFEGAGQDSGRPGAEAKQEVL
jgi:hypothetical protein